MFYCPSGGHCIELPSLVLCIALGDRHQVERISFAARSRDGFDRAKLRSCLLLLLLASAQNLLETSPVMKRYLAELPY